jgi:hypothetical protein
MTGDGEYNELFKHFTALVCKHEEKHSAPAFIMKQIMT